MPAADFYFAINATFRYILDNHGEQALIGYWRAMGERYFAPLSERFRAGGLDEVERYWRAFFDKEPGGDVRVEQSDDRVLVDVRDCPAIGWLRANGREIVPLYCQHCHHVSSAVASSAGLAFALEGGGGSCRQSFSVRSQP